MKIDKNVPIPELNPNRGGAGLKRATRNQYPFDDMEVGDSFLCINRTAAQVITSARSWSIRRKNTHQFITRTLPEGLRVWRTK